MGGISETGEELAESPRGSRAYSSLKILGFGIRRDGSCVAAVSDVANEVESRRSGRPDAIGLLHSPLRARHSQIVAPGSEERTNSPPNPIVLSPGSKVRRERNEVVVLVDCGRSGVKCSGDDD